MQKFVRSEVKFTASAAFVEVVGPDRLTVTIRQTFDEHEGKKVAQNVNQLAKIFTAGLNMDPEKLDNMILREIAHEKDMALISEAKRVRGKAFDWIIKAVAIVVMALCALSMIFAVLFFIHHNTHH